MLYVHNGFHRPVSLGNAQLRLFPICRPKIWRSAWKFTPQGKSPKLIPNYLDPLLIFFQPGGVPPLVQHKNHQDLSVLYQGRRTSGPPGRSCNTQTIKIYQFCITSAEWRTPLVFSSQGLSGVILAQAGIYGGTAAQPGTQNFKAFDQTGLLPRAGIASDAIRLKCYSFFSEPPTRIAPGRPRRVGTG